MNTPVRVAIYLQVNIQLNILIKAFPYYAAGFWNDDKGDSSEET